MKHELVINNMIKLRSNCAAQINYFVIYFYSCTEWISISYNCRTMCTMYSSHPQMLLCSFCSFFLLLLFSVVKCWMLLFSFQLIKICNLTLCACSCFFFVFISAQPNKECECGKWIDFQRKTNWKIFMSKCNYNLFFMR